MLAILIFGSLDVGDDACGAPVGTCTLDELGAAVFLVALETACQGARVVRVKELLDAIEVPLAVDCIAHDVIRPTVHASG